MKALVLAGGYDQIALIQQLQKRGYECILADYWENPPAARYANRHIQASTLDVDRIRQIAVQEQAELVVTACTDQALLTVAKVSEDLGLPCYINYRTGLNVTNKFYMKKRFLEWDIPSARHCIVDGTEGLEEKISGLRWPLVVKPVDCNSSRGVTKVESRQALVRAVEEDIILSRTGTAVIEEFISGREYTVDFWIDHGEAKLLMASEIMKIEGSFTINGCRTLPDLSEDKLRQLSRIAQKIAKAFGLDNMPMFMQVMDNGSEIFVLEFSARMGGGTKYRMIDLYAGVPIMEVYVDRVCGICPKISDDRSTKRMLLYFLYCTKGTYQSIEGLDALMAEGLVDEWYGYKQPGAYIEKAENSGDRVAGILISGDSDEEIERKRAEACRRLRVLDTEGRDMMLRF